MEITKAEFAKIEGLLPVVRGNSCLDALTTLNAMLFIAENGCKWRSLPEKYGRWHSIYMRINRWAKNGVLEKVFRELRDLRGFNIPMMYLDATIVKVHPNGTGALKKTESKQSENQKADLPQKYISWLQANIQHTK